MFCDAWIKVPNEDPFRTAQAVLGHFTMNSFCRNRAAEGQQDYVIFAIQKD